MAAPPGQIPGRASGGDGKAGVKTDRREQVRGIVMVALAVLITLFAVFNLNQVKVNWVFGSGHAPLIIVIVISLLVGIVLTYVADRRTRKRK